jgi:hypothetical protein
MPADIPAPLVGGIPPQVLFVPTPAPPPAH